MVTLQCKQLIVGYDKPLCKPLNFDLRAGEMVQLKGYNGSGKTTFLKTVLGSVSCFLGEYVWNVPVSTIGYLPQHQDHSQYFSYTLGEILGLFDIPQEYLKNLSTDLLTKKWSQASGGEKQRILILTRIGLSTRVLILDEPFNHLDKQTTGDVSKFLQQLLLAAEPVAILLVSHLNTELKNGFVRVVEINA